MDKTRPRGALLALLCLAAVWGSLAAKHKHKVCYFGTVILRCTPANGDVPGTPTRGAAEFAARGGVGTRQTTLRHASLCPLPLRNRGASPRLAPRCVNCGNGRARRWAWGTCGDCGMMRWRWALRRGWAPLRFCQDGECGCGGHCSLSICAHGRAPRHCLAHEQQAAPLSGLGPLSGFGPAQRGLARRSRLRRCAPMRHRRAPSS